MGKVSTTESKQSSSQGVGSLGLFRSDYITQHVMVRVLHTDNYGIFYISQSSASSSHKQLNAEWQDSQVFPSASRNVRTTI